MSIIDLPFAAATSSANGVTDGGGNYSFSLAAPPTGAHVDVWYRGDDTYFAAYTSP